MASILDDSIGRGVATSSPGVVVAPGGSGAVESLLLLSALGGNGLGNRKDCVDNAALNGLRDGLNNNAILSTLGDIKSSIPMSVCEVNLAMAGQTDQITRTVTNGQTALMQGQAALQLAEATSTAAIQANICNTSQNLLAGQAAINTNIDRTGMSIINAIRDDGNATRALITAQAIQDLRDKHLIATNELAELRSERNRDRDRHGLEITMVQSNNQVALQNQETKFEFERMRNLMFDTVQSVRATNSAINIGAGTLTSNPTNTNTNTSVRG
jgi:hypothetical protein